MKKLFLNLFWLLLFSGVQAAAVQLPQSGQTTVYSATDDGDLKAGRPWPQPRFSDTGNQVVIDDLTGLMWAKDANLLKSRDPGLDMDGVAGDGAVSWQHALEYLHRLNVEKYLGYSDWRLPNLNELASILNQGEPVITLWLVPQGFTNVQISHYWTSSSVASDAVQAWAINFETGTITPTSKFSVAHIWPVRDGESVTTATTVLSGTGQDACYNSSGRTISCRGTGQDAELHKGIRWPNPRFSENSDETVTDTLTGLVWVKNANLIALLNLSLGSSTDGRVIWPEALEYVIRLNRDAYLGHADWRLPNRNELISLVNYAESNPLGWVNIQGFSDAQEHYWSSGTSAMAPSNAWNVFLSGAVSERNKYNSANGSFVWPVRGGTDTSLITPLTAGAESASFQSSAMIVTQSAAATATLTVSTSSLTAGTVGISYSQTLAATGGTTPFTWSKKSGSLPAGLTLSTTGVISGTPTTTGTNTFTVQVKDKVAKTATKSLSITINAGPLSLTTVSLADGYLASAYSQTLTATGGKTAYTWAITSGALPSGLTLAVSTGVISGTPAASGTKNITIQVKDAANTTATKSLTITVYALPAISTTSLSAGAVGIAYSQSLAVSGGKTIFLWSLSGALPTGLTLNSATGVISGVPASAGTSSFMVQVKDSNSKTATKALSIIVNAIPLTIETSTLANAYLAKIYSQTLTATGGKAPYVWSVAGGSLPVGLTLNASTGVISGAPTSSGTYGLIVQLADANNVTVTRALNLAVYAPLVIAPATLNDGYINMDYVQRLSVTGGQYPYTWSIINGTLPMGLALAVDAGNPAFATINGTSATGGGTTFTVQVKDDNNTTSSKSFTLNLTDFGTLSGAVTDRISGAALSGVTVTLNLTGITSKNQNDRLYSCNVAPFTAPDYIMVESNDGSRFACSTPASASQFTTFKVRNPFGSNDSFTARWTGTSTLLDDEFLAQSFNPARTGLLTKVSMDIVSADRDAAAWVYLQLKSSLEGGPESLLAESQFTMCSSTGTICGSDFVFPTPVTITAGRRYYLVLKGEYHYANGALPQHYLRFVNGAAQASTPTYIRNKGAWNQADSTLVFQTFTDDQPDVAGPPSGQLPYLQMVGNGDQKVGLAVFNRSTGQWVPGANLLASSEGDATSEGGYVHFSKGDEYLTLELPVSGGMSDYYDQNGWVMVRIENTSLQNSSLLSDQFNLTFTRTLTTVTDGNGAYSFTSLPDGTYTLTFDKSGYATETVGGTLLPGQTLNHGSTIARAPVINTNSTLSPGIIGSPYTQMMTATDGLPPYTWAISSGSLPAGLGLNATTGSITGTPTSSRNGSFTIQVKDSINTPATKSFTLFVGSGSISGAINDQESGAPLPGVTVALNLTGITSVDTADRVYSCNTTPLAPTEYDTVAANDSAKFSCLTGGSANAMLFKVRNPYGADPFTIKWNGMLSTYYENLAQSFMPTVGGNLTKVSFYLPHGIAGAYYGPLGGEVHLQLKSGLGGDAGTQLAESTSIPIESLLPGTPQWVDFVFPNPAPVVAGQEYYLELQGRIQRGYPDTWWQYQPETISWGNGILSAIGSAYAKQAGFWTVLDHPLAFRTYLNNNTDLSLEPAANQGTTSMSGIIGEYIRMAVFNRTTAMWETGGTVVGTVGYLDHDIAMGGYGYRGDDLTIDWTMSTGLDRYYDQNGWLAVKIDNYTSYWATESPATSLVTDQFKLSFNRTLTTVTDARGAYSFPPLLAGAYSITLDKTAYVTATTSGTLSPGQNLNVGSTLQKAAPASLHGIIRLNTGDPLSGVLVTITDPLGSRSAVSDVDGSYLVVGIIPGAYTVAFVGTGVNTLTQTGSLSSGQSKTIDLWLTAAPITLTIDSPADGAVISSLPLEVTGSVHNADSITANVINNGVTTSYPATITNGTYSVSIPLESGQTRIYVGASSRYHLYAEKSVAVTQAAFTVHNLGDTGAVTVMEATGNYDAKNPDGSINDQPRQTIAREYFKSHADSDFLVMLTTFDHAMPEATAKGFYRTVKNDTQGINQPLMDHTSLYGSQGKLQGTIDLGNVTELAATPFGPKLDETLTTLSHELLHRFGAYVRFKNADGSLNNALLGKDSAHWSYLLDSQGSVMYGNGWKANSDGTFTSTAARSGYSPLDLYLMGMIPKEQAPPMLLIENSAIDKTKLPELGATISGTAKIVTIDDIIAAEGARIPDSTTAQKKFTVGFVLLTRSGDSSTTAATAIETLRSAWAGRLAELTQGTGGINGIAPAISVVIDSPVEGATVTGPSVAVTGAVINTSGAETGVTINGIPAAINGNRFILNQAPVQSGANSLVVTATDFNGLTGTITRSVTAQAGHYLRIVPSVEWGTAPLDLTLTLSGSFSITTPHVSVTGPMALTLAQGTNPTEFIATVTAEGSYTVTATAVGPDGQTYSASVTVTVVNRTKLENLLQAKWAGMKAKIAATDINGALGYIANKPQTRYREFLTALGAQLPLMNDYLRDIELVYMTDGYAKCRLYRNKTIMGQVYNIEYVVYFVQEQGIWKLYQF